MTRWLTVRIVVLALMFAIGAGPAVAAGQPQTSPPATPPQPSSGTRPSPPAASAPARFVTGRRGAVPISDAALARIRKGVAADATLKLDDRQFRYYVQILAKQQAFTQFTKGYNWKDGATRGGNPMTHQEFLNMVTPREMYSSAGITPTDLLQFSITNWLGQALIKKALNDISNARTERELREIRDRIDRELALLRGGGS